MLGACGTELALDEGHAALDYRDPAGEPCVPDLPSTSGLAHRPDLRACFTLEGARLGQDTSSTLGDTHFSLTRWIPKSSESPEYIGFTLTTDGDLAYVVESGEERFRGSTAGWMERSSMIGASTTPISLVAICPIVLAAPPTVDVEQGGALEWQTRTTTTPRDEQPEVMDATVCDASGCCQASAG
jgi:hypothetical protein